jgi:hypothetical protein
MDAVRELFRVDTTGLRAALVLEPLQKLQALASRLPDFHLLVTGHEALNGERWDARLKVLLCELFRNGFEHTDAISGKCMRWEIRVVVQARIRALWLRSSNRPTADALVHLRARQAELGEHSHMISRHGLGLCRWLAADCGGSFQLKKADPLEVVWELNVPLLLEQ